MRNATVIEMALRVMACSACGAEANASCNCGKPYVPAKQRARQAIEANPHKSNRAIADKIGVDEKTVRTARGADISAPEREGLDGKVYRLPVRAEDDLSKEELAATKFKIAADDVVETAQSALGFVNNMEFSKDTATACLTAVDQIIAQWCAVKVAIEGKLR